MMRENSRSRDFASFNGVVRRMVSLPRNILGGFSRAVGHGINDLMAIGERRNQIFSPPPLPPPLTPPQFPVFPPHYAPKMAMINDEWAFLNNFEQSFGATHPFFYACRFIQALKIAQDEKKLLFLYLHSPNHPFAAEFCRETLCSEVVVEFLDANFVSWGAIADRGEGFQISGLLRPAGFPFCAVIAPASDDNIAVIQQLEGPVSPADLLEILQLTLEEQGVAFGRARAKEEEKRRADSQLREEQDVAYLAALSLDQERQRLEKSPPEQAVQNPVARVLTATPNTGTSKSPGHSQSSIKRTQVREVTNKRDNQPKENCSETKGKQVTQILLRFPNGERREHGFSSTDKVEAIYEYIESLGLPGIENYRLISSFPRKVYESDQMSMTLKDAGLHPRASLFLELL